MGSCGNLRELLSVARYLGHSTLGLWRPLLPLLASAALLTLAYAPINQFYLAWVGLAPWLIFVRNRASQKSAFLGSWLAGTIFFTANMWWMGYITIPGMLALMVYCGIYWAFAAVIIRGAGLLSRGLLGIAAIAAIWVAFEWLRGNLMTGLPWLFLGHTQSPILPMCQVSDVVGAYGVSFWVVMVNALAAMAWMQRANLKPLWPSAAAVAGILAGVLAYGELRIHQTPSHLVPGPLVAVVQSNYPQSNSGAKGATINDRLAFHRNETIKAADAEAGHLALAVWSETMMYPMNQEALFENENLRELYAILSKLTSFNHVALLTGGEYAAKWVDVTREGVADRIPQDKRNTAYFFDKDGQMSDLPGRRYDKIHLVPWGEFIPFKHTIPALYNVFLYLGPKYYADYELESGSPTALTVFSLEDQNHIWHFVTPICFEDIDPRICTDMFYPENGGGKRADFLVNITNDGWFKANENAQHLQAAVFRSIENRVPTARSVNTGISGFIDSTGQTHHLLDVRTAGTSTARMMIDNRVTFYTRFGDVFAILCIAGTSLIALRAFIHRSGKTLQK